MMVAAWRDARPGVRISILATDLSTEVLAVARDAIYPEAMVAVVPPEFRQRYLLRSRDRTRRLVRIVPELRAWVRFARLNLMDEDYPVDRDFDVIFCRNVLIYFDKPTQRLVLRRLCQHLRAGGYLFLGAFGVAGRHGPAAPLGGQYGPQARAMKPPVKVLIVDDSAIVRQTLSEVLAADPEIVVIGTASDPFVAARRIQSDVPDVITWMSRCRAWTASPSCGS